MAKISDMDWAQHIKMDYVQNLRKDPKKAKQTTLNDKRLKTLSLTNHLKWNVLKSNEMESCNIHGFMKIHD